MKEHNRQSSKKIQYADLCDIVTMLNICPSGGLMKTVNKAQDLVREPEKTDLPYSFGIFNSVAV